MSTSENILQLKEPGEGITMRVTKCAPMTIGSYPEIEFVGVTSDGRTVAVRVPKKCADRQLERLNLDYAASLGRTLSISRSANGQQPSKPFWDIYEADEPVDAPQRVATKADAAPSRRTQSAAATPAAGSPTVKEKKGAAFYLELTDFVLDKVVPRYKDRGVTLTPEAIVASVATLYSVASQ